MTIGAERWQDLCRELYEGDLVSLAVAIVDGKHKPDHHLEYLMTDTIRWAAKVRIEQRQHPKPQK